MVITGKPVFFVYPIFRIQRPKTRLLKEWDRGRVGPELRAWYGRWDWGRARIRWPSKAQSWAASFLPTRDCLTFTAEYMIPAPHESPTHGPFGTRWAWWLSWYYKIGSCLISRWVWLRNFDFVPFYPFKFFPFHSDKTIGHNLWWLIWCRASLAGKFLPRRWGIWVTLSCRYPICDGSFSYICEFSRKYKTINSYGWTVSEVLTGFHLTF